MGCSGSRARLRWVGWGHHGSQVLVDPERSVSFWGESFGKSTSHILGRNSPSSSAGPISVRRWWFSLKGSVLPFTPVCTPVEETTDTKSLIPVPDPLPDATGSLGRPPEETHDRRHYLRVGDLPGVDSYLRVPDDPFVGPPTLPRPFPSPTPR